MREISTKTAGVLAFATAVVYYVSNPKPNHYYDYTFRVAENLLQGSVGFAEKPPSWLNEFVPFEGLWFSVFPFGAVISMVPFALMKVLGLYNEMPSALIYSLTAGLCCFFLLKIAAHYEVTFSRAVLLTGGILFGSFLWTNLTLGGAWQLALGFALVGELGAIYFAVYNRRPALAGAFFALAFGNRTEILLTAAVFLYLLSRRSTPDSSEGSDPKEEDVKGILRAVDLRKAAAFCLLPLILGVSTLVYNFHRFGSFTDFGYARIPGVLNEPWYNHGIFSVRYILRQAWEMLLKPWKMISDFPYLVPDGFSSSILISSPFILLALRVGSHDKVLKYCAWIAIGLMTLVLWMHGNSGGWQFGYRYWIVCLPWIFVLLLESSRNATSHIERAIYIFSFAANAYATWLFHWTSYLRP